MATASGISVSLFVLSSALLAASYQTTFAFDRPVHSAVIACFVIAITLLLLNRYAARVLQTSSWSHECSAIPLAERSDHHRSRGPSPESAKAASVVGVARARTWAPWILLTVVACILCGRIELYRQIMRHNECSSDSGFGSAIPFVVSLYDYWRNQRRRPVEKDTAPDRLLYGWIRCVVPRSRLRYVLSTALLMGGGFLASSFHDARDSTYICSLILGDAQRVRVLNVLCAILDTLLLIGAGELARKETRSRGGKEVQLSVLWGYGFLGVAVFWAIVGLNVLISRPQDRGYILSLSSNYMRSALAQAFLLAVLIGSAVQMAPDHGILGLSTLTALVLICLSLLSTLWNGRQPFPLTPSCPAVVPLLLISAGAALFLHAGTVSEEEPKASSRQRTWFRKVFFLMCGLGFYLAVQQHPRVMLHPIDLLISNGRGQHDAWLTQANSSSNLEEAMLEYRRRYNQHPPPGFDKWYEYATNRSSVVIDDFDQIYHDLLPFRSLTPQRLRELTHKLATNPFNDVGAISIRHGVPKVQEGIKPTHAWMVAGAAKMIEPFSQHLPDMDIAFNLNDEPRIAVPYESITLSRNIARSQSPAPEDRVQNGWSVNRGSVWPSIEPADQTEETVFTDVAWRNIFDDPASLICPPSSRARTTRVWDRHNLCLSCVRPHSLGQFLSDWDLASDICHQPDLRFLHGFFISPASLKASQELVPLFSQSSVRGFSDILFPSPWNYIDKVKYEPSDEHPDPVYTDKENTLFWIGATSEGVSHDGGWKGMARQRFTHLMNNNTLNKVSVLVPSGEPGTYTYKILDGQAPSAELGLNTSVHIAEGIVRCGDCDTQERELRTVGKVDFQDHWRYRFLFDLDGAGFSGRFLPFLQSRSVPFKTALFRQWFDSRITAWRHFVPQDLRLHSVWSTLAYFAGISVKNEGGKTTVLMDPHTAEGLWIADQGRQWAAQALRKEDMEIYFFRLLLEWARLTDDRRDELGFKLG
ncbi:hypothetical protein VTN02DRAFT_6387 [Thermoascus thermophilus]